MCKSKERTNIKSVLLFLFWCISIHANVKAQSDSTWKQHPTITISGFMDVFYTYDFNKPQGIQRQSFLYNHNRHNELNLNLGLVKINLEHNKYRANFAMHAGTYVQDNYSSEPHLLKNIAEANIGIALNKRANFWLNAGIFPSHIGFESALSSENWTLTRSLLAENSPYFLSGAKFTFNPNEKLEIAGLMLNGWQRIQRLVGNSMPSFGSQINFKVHERVKLNWSSFLGTDDPDSTRRMRYLNNFYGQFQLSKKVGFIGGFDLGFQQLSKNSTSYNLWLSLVGILQLNISETWKSAIRIEYYQDRNGVMIPTNTPSGFKTLGFSGNVDYYPTENVVCRIEARWLRSRDRIFQTPTDLSNNNFFIALSCAIRFSQNLHK